MTALEPRAQFSLRREPPPMFNKRLFKAQAGIAITEKILRILRRPPRQRRTAEELNDVKGVVSALKEIHRGLQFIKEALCTVVTYEKIDSGVEICQEGHGNCLPCFYILSGSVEARYRITNDTNAAKTRQQDCDISYTHVAGEFLGLVSGDGAMYDYPPPDSIRTMEVSEFLIIDRELFHQTVKDVQEQYVQEIEDFVNRGSLLSKLPAEERKKLVPFMAKQEYPAGKVIVKQGDSSEHLFFVAQGRCQYYRNVDITEVGREELVRLGQAEKGDFFGESVVIDGCQSFCSVASIGSVTCYLVNNWVVKTNEHLLQLLREHRRSFHGDADIMFCIRDSDVWQSFKRELVVGLATSAKKADLVVNSKQMALPLSRAVAYGNARRRFSKPVERDEMPGAPKPADPLFVELPYWSRRTSAILTSNAAAVVKAVLLLRGKNDAGTAPAERHAPARHAPAISTSPELRFPTFRFGPSERKTNSAPAGSRSGSRLRSESPIGELRPLTVAGNRATKVHRSTSPIPRAQSISTRKTRAQRSATQSPGQGSRERSPGSGTQSPGSGVRSLGPTERSPGSRTRSPGSGGRRPEPTERCPGSRTRSPGSGARNPGSRSQRPGSGVRSPGYARTPSNRKSPQEDSRSGSAGAKKKKNTPFERPELPAIGVRQGAPQEMAGSSAGKLSESEAAVVCKSSFVVKEIINTGLPGRKAAPAAYRRFPPSMFEVLDEKKESRTEISPWGLSLMAGKWLRTIKKQRRSPSPPEEPAPSPSPTPIIVIQDWSPEGVEGEERVDSPHAQKPVMPSHRRGSRKMSRTPSPALDDVAEESEEQIKVYEEAAEPGDEKWYTEIHEARDLSYRELAMTRQDVEAMEQRRRKTRPTNDPEEQLAEESAEPTSQPEIGADQEITAKGRRLSKIKSAKFSANDDGGLERNLSGRSRSRTFSGTTDSTRESSDGNSRARRDRGQLHRAQSLTRLRHRTISVECDVKPSSQDGRAGEGSKGERKSHTRAPCTAARKAAERTSKRRHRLLRKVLESVTRYQS